MERQIKKQIKRCPTCGTIIDSKYIADREIRKADESLKRYYNKLRKKNEAL